MINDKKKFNWKTLPELFFEEAKKQLDKPLLWYKINNQYKSLFLENCKKKNFIAFIQAYSIRN